MSVSTSLNLPGWMVRLAEFVIGAWLVMAALGVVLVITTLIVIVILALVEGRR